MKKLTAVGDRTEDRAWTAAVAAVLLASCVVVPSLFTTRLDAVFVVPKLAALWAALALGLVVIAGGLLLSGGPIWDRRLWPIDVAVASFVVLNIAAWVASTDRQQSLYGERLQYQGLLTALLYVGFFCLARVALTDLRRVTLLFGAITTGAALVAGYALVQRAGLDPVWDGYLPSGRVFSSIGQPNALAAYLVIAIPLAVPLLHWASGVMRGVLVLAVAAMVAALILTLSRGGYLGFFASLLVLLVGARPQLRARGRRVVSYALATALAAGIAFVALAQTDRLSSSWDFSQESSVRIHLDFWTVATHMALDHPVLGTGQETFPDHFPRYSHEFLAPDRASYLDAYRVESPHNVYLGVAAGTGFPTLAAYAGIIAAFAYVVIRAAGSASWEVRLVLIGVLAAAVGHVVTDVFMSPDLTSTWLFWVLLGTGAGVAARYGSGRDQSAH